MQKTFRKFMRLLMLSKVTGQLVVKAKEAVATESLPRSLREIYQCYTKLVDEMQRAESTKYTVAQAYQRGYAFECSSDPAGINLYLAH